MAIIKVNHAVIKEVADEAASYSSSQAIKMLTTNVQMSALLVAGWKGSDAQSFKSKWDDIDSKDSVTKTLKSSLDYFSTALEECASIYQRAQEDTYNEANKLPKYIIW